MKSQKAVLDIKRSKELKEKLKTKQGVCFYNSSANLREVNDKEALYVEGLLCKGFYMIEHGWIVTKGKIIDLTLNELSEDFEYYPILEYTKEEMLKNIIKTCGKTPFYIHGQMEIKRKYKLRRNKYEAWGIPIHGTIRNEKERKEIIKRINRGKLG